jgi:hypothetical protein
VFCISSFLAGNILSAVGFVAACNEPGFGFLSEFWV